MTFAHTEIERKVLTMAEYIKRESIQKALKNVTDDPSCPLFLAAMIEQYIDQEPAADVVEVKHGRWIDKGEYAICMECGGRSGTQYDGVEPTPLMTQFCPNCGARMDRNAE